VSITAADITIPTTLDLNAAPQCLPSLEETRKHRAQQARHQTAACPHCGEWAIVETVTVNRPGLPGVVQTISRCQRQPRWRGERCPVTILSEEWAEDQPEVPETEEESMPETRPCVDCGAPIQATHGRLRCPECKRESERAAAKPAQRPARPKPAAPLPDAPVPAALRVSVLELAQRAVEGASIRATMRAILALSPERQDLLRRLLDDVEAA
jgi:hypothetical protein